MKRVLAFILAIKGDHLYQYFLRFPTLHCTMASSYREMAKEFVYLAVVSLWLPDHCIKTFCKTKQEILNVWGIIPFIR